MNKALLALTAAAAITLTSGAFAQSKSTPGNPGDAGAATVPTGRSDSTGGTMMKSPSPNGTSTPAGPAATGAGENMPTATGGQPGGSPSKN